MKLINKGNGVFYVEMENERDIIVPKHLFYKNQEAIEIHFPEGIKIINDEAMPFCYSLERVYLPSSIEQLRHGIFYGNSNKKIEIYFNGSVTKFKKISRPYKAIVYVNASGPYDHYPYYSSEGSYNEERVETRHFDVSCAEIEVICNDGKRLYYGYSNNDKKN